MAVSLSMVALGKDAKVSGRAICDAWRTRWPRATQPASMEKKESTFSFHVGEHLVAFGLMPAPIPGMAGEEQPEARTPFWPNAAADLRQHQRHVIITVVGGAKPIDEMRVLTQAVVALVESCQGAGGVYWPSSELLFPPKSFCDIACRFLPDSFALPIWINIRLAKGKDGSSAGFTRGLAALGHKEFETTKSPESTRELRERLLGLAGYVLQHGRVINDGDTIGEDANERIKVTYGPSSFGVLGEVMRLDYSSPKRSRGGLTAYGYIHLLATIVCTILFGYLLYAWFPFLRGSVFRHFVLVPVTLVFGVLLLLISDQLLENTLGLHAFRREKS